MLRLKRNHLKSVINEVTHILHFQVDDTGGGWGDDDDDW